MGNIPLSSALGISMSIFGTLYASPNTVKSMTSWHIGQRIGVIAIKACNGKLPANHEITGEIVTIAVGFFCAVIGMTVHAANLDFDPAMRSFTYAFVGANLTIGWRIWAGVEGNWLDFVPNLAIVVVSGLILGLLTSKGDVQKETKERWRREAQAKLSADSKSHKKKPSE
jgi:hypothetical protein